MNCGNLTEHVSQTNPDRENFPKRNRIVAGISDAVIVVEAAHKGGALITAEIANTYNRDVFAVPGRLNDTYSQGCNRLIKTNKAVLIESAADLVYILGWEIQKEKSKSAPQRKLFVDLSADENAIVQLLNQQPMLACQSQHCNRRRLHQHRRLQRRRNRNSLLQLPHHRRHSLPRLRLHQRNPHQQRRLTRRQTTSSVIRW